MLIWQNICQGWRSAQGDFCNLVHFPCGSTSAHESAPPKGSAYKHTQTLSNMVRAHACLCACTTYLQKALFYLLDSMARIPFSLIWHGLSTLMIRRPSLLPKEVRRFNISSQCSRANLNIELRMEQFCWLQIFHSGKGNLSARHL